MNHPVEGTVVSQGTLRPEDLAVAFYEFLFDCAPEKARRIRRQYADVLEALVQGFLHEDMYNLIEALVWALDEIAPPGCYFGAHPGDGACFGFWKILEV